MSVQNIRSFNPSNPLSQNDQEELYTTQSRGQILTALTVTIATIAQIIIGSLGIAGKLNDPVVGWGTVASAGAFIIFPALLFMCETEENRTNAAALKYTCVPFLIQAAPITCGILGGIGQLSSHTVGIVSVSMIGGLFGLVCCCACCYVCCLGCLKDLGEMRENRPLFGNRVVPIAN